MRLLYHTFANKSRHIFSNDASPFGDMMHLLRKYDAAPLRRSCRSAVAKEIGAVARERKYQNGLRHLGATPKQDEFYYFIYLMLR